MFIIRSTVLVTLLFAGAVKAKIGDDFQTLNACYGKPVYNENKERGLIYFRKDGLCIIAHFYSDRCDELSIFSEEQFGGIPESLSLQRILFLLNREGGQPWSRVPRFSMNDIWRSQDGRLFAIYETMLHKLIIMTREAYVREKRVQTARLSSH